MNLRRAPGMCLYRACIKNIWRFLVWSSHVFSVHSVYIHVLCTLLSLYIIRLYMCTRRFYSITMINNQRTSRSKTRGWRKFHYANLNNFRHCFAIFIRSTGEIPIIYFFIKPVLSIFYTYYIRICLCRVILLNILHNDIEWFWCFNENIVWITSVLQ